MTKPIIIRLPSGEEYGVASFAVVEKFYPEAEVVSYQDGSEYNGKQVPAVQKRLDAEAEGTGKQETANQQTQTSTKDK